MGAVPGIGEASEYVDQRVRGEQGRLRRNRLFSRQCNLLSRSVWAPTDHAPIVRGDHSGVAARASAVAGRIRTDGATVAAKLLLDALRREGPPASA